MKGILAGIFLGVFMGALGYEIINRSNPDAVESIRKKVADGVDNFMGSTDVGEFDDDINIESDEEPLAV